MNEHIELTVARFYPRVVSALRPFSFRGKGRLLSRIVPRRGHVSLELNGITFEDLDLSEHGQWHVYCGLFEVGETRAVTAYLKPGMNIVDVGANIGYYTALGAAAAGPSGRVIAFEPSPYAYQRLRNLVLNNRLTNVTTFQMALSDQKGKAQLSLPKDSTNHAPTMLPLANSASVPIEVTTLDEVAGEIGMDSIDLLKLDVEGLEPRVLSGARRLLAAGRIKSVLCEFNRHWLKCAGTTPEALRNTLLNYGFDDGMRGAPPTALETRLFFLRGIVDP
jgi:FkbM family methyltransferase